MKIQIINGPNLNLLGLREKDVYGDISFEIKTVAAFTYSNTSFIEWLILIVEPKSNFGQIKRMAVRQAPMTKSDAFIFGIFILISSFSSSGSSLIILLLTLNLPNRLKCLLSLSSGHSEIR